jgi:phosphatidylserine/phosphatidylglycerophosphate/cardiolipin synthase-like enzyme
MRIAAALLTLGFAVLPASAHAERLCDPSYEDCRAILLNLIRNETAGIDAAFWFMEDPRYTHELIKRWQSGVPVRVLVDTQANGPTALNAHRLAELTNAGIPIRERTASGILHWKMMLFSGQNTVQFSAANYSEWAFVPVDPYRNYVDEAIYFTDHASIVNSFRTKFDDLWTNTSTYSSYANISGPLTRRYATFTKDPELNFAPDESYRSRAVERYNVEVAGIDVIMYRITDRSHADAMIRAIQRGVPVRLITEPNQYRDRTRLWHSWNVDRLYMAGVQIRHRAHAGLVHQKSVLLRGQRMSIFGSSNWTSPSSDSQEEHNYFTTKSWIVDWFIAQFERKWNNLAGAPETQPFQPLPPDAPVYLTPANGATGVSTAASLSFDAGPFAHLYDIYFGVSSTPPLLASNVALGATVSRSSPRQFALPTLAPGTTYYWRVVAKTMAHRHQSGPVWTFTTGGASPAGRSDFDGDSRLDITVWRPSTGQWFTRTSSSGYVNDWEILWGLTGDVPVPGDYNGNGVTDVAVWRPSTGVWYVCNQFAVQWGWPGDVPVPGDYNGDGVTDLAVWRPSTGVWYVRGLFAIQWGWPGDVPVPGDYNGDGAMDVGVWRPSTGAWYVPNQFAFQWGHPLDVPVPADYNGDGVTDVALWRPSAGTWHVLNQLDVQWGWPDDVPVPGDYDGDGLADIAVWRPSTGTWHVRGQFDIQWGLPDDTPLGRRRR